MCVCGGGGWHRDYSRTKNQLSFFAPFRKNSTFNWFIVIWSHKVASLPLNQFQALAYTLYVKSNQFKTQMLSTICLLFDADECSNIIWSNMLSTLPKSFVQ